MASKEREQRHEHLRRIPKVTVEDGVFYVDVGIDGIPILALTPHLMGRTLSAGRQAYAEWEKADRAKRGKKG